MENHKKSLGYLHEKEDSPLIFKSDSYVKELNGDKQHKMGDEVFSFFKMLVLAVAITGLMNVFIFNLSQVKQRSMEATLFEGERLILEKLSYSFGSPNRGDIIVFISPESPVEDSISARFVRLYEDIMAKYTNTKASRRLVKRVIGLPGDEIDIRQGKVFINGTELTESYIHQPTQEKDSLTFPVIVPENHYFVMGDNRQNSHDSRDFNSIDRKQIEGKIMFRIWPLNKLGGL